VRKLRWNQLGSDSASGAVGREASHLIGALTAAILFRSSIDVDINDAFRNTPVASDAIYRGMLVNYGFESHEPSILS